LPLKELFIMKKLLYALVFLPLVTNCGKKPLLHKTIRSLGTINTTITEHHPMITVWVHGTTFNRVTRPFHASKQGLHRVTPSQEQLIISRSQKYAHILHTCDPHRFALNHFYTFCWSGELSFKARKTAAQQLHKTLLKELDAYHQQHGIRPGVRLITHSHGGNVALNLAQVKEPGSTLIIDELILLACPAQQATSDYIKDTFFKKIYSLYSTNDLLQIADPQGLYSYESQGLNKESIQTKPTFFSERIFPLHPTLVQASLVINEKAPSHLDFILESFIKHLPAILNELDDLHEQLRTGKLPLEDSHCRLTMST
jgi:hypothetical protein